MPTPNTADAMKRYRAGKAGFTDKAHLKAKGLIPRADGTKRKSPKYEDLDKGDVKTIKPIIKQLKKFYQIGNYSIISSSSIILTIFLPLITALTLAHS